mmetsp:Transcript_35556/g.69755  ORF Transcript_35556/g.69755 Transcript_35556/m.69755 type:complete len:203 (-) Transcript_35556:1192-1800(-)
MSSRSLVYMSLTLAATTALLMLSMCCSPSRRLSIWLSSCSLSSLPCVNMPTILVSEPASLFCFSVSLVKMSLSPLLTRCFSSFSSFSPFSLPSPAPSPPSFSDLLFFLSPFFLFFFFCCCCCLTAIVLTLLALPATGELLPSLASSLLLSSLSLLLSNSANSANLACSRFIISSLMALPCRDWCRIVRKYSNSFSSRSSLSW